jgi:hypothetical protein
MSQSIGLSELIQQVKQDLLASAAENQPLDAPVFYVESVELELKVTVKREGAVGAGIKIDVLPGLASLGGDAKGTLSNENAHSIKVKLSPLYSKEQLLEWQRNCLPDQARETAIASTQALMKDPDGDLGQQY